MEQMMQANQGITEIDIIGRLNHSKEHTENHECGLFGCIPAPSQSTTKPELLSDKEISECIKTSLADESENLSDYIWVVTDADRLITQAQLLKCQQQEQERMGELIQVVEDYYQLSESDFRYKYLDFIGNSTGTYEVYLTSYLKAKYLGGQK